MTKKDEKLVDLEYMIPKEHKEESKSTETDPEPEQSTLALRENCYSCGKDSEEIVLLPVFHRGEDKWICPNCLKNHLGTDTYNAYTQPSYSSTSSMETSPPESSPSSESSNPMSMFD